MSNGTTPTPSVIPQTISWSTLLLAISTAIFGTLHFGKPAPTPVNPNNNPPVVVNPPVDPPVIVNPHIDPTPVNPSPTPIQPTTLTITDEGGNAIAGGVNAGQMFIVNAPFGQSIMGVAHPSGSSASIITVADNKMICTLQAGGSLEVVSYGNGKPTIRMITCNQAPQPPPVPNVTPVTPPVNPPVNPPAPIDNTTPPYPSKTNLLIGIVDDPRTRTTDVSKILENHAMWSRYRGNGHKIMLWDNGSNPSKEKVAQEDIAAVKAKNLSTGIVIRKPDSTLLYAGPIPTSSADVSALLFQYGGA